MGVNEVLGLSESGIKHLGFHPFFLKGELSLIMAKLVFPHTQGLLYRCLEVTFILYTGKIMVATTPSLSDDIDDILLFSRCWIFLQYIFI